MRIKTFPKLRLLVIQRVSLSHSKLTSRSIGARFYPLLNSMEKKGILIWESILEQDVTIEDLKKFDAILFNKHTSDLGLKILNMATGLGLMSIYDMDDWIFDLPSYSVTNLGEDQIGNVIKYLRKVSHVTVSNNNLQNKLSHICNSYILPNGIDLEYLGMAPQNFFESNPPKIIFSNTDGIKLVNARNEFFEMLSDFLAKNLEVKLDFWGDYFPELSKIKGIIQRGFLENIEYKREIMKNGYMFAIAPLGGTEDVELLEFNSCKTCIKYIDYGALGIPGIYSASPVYQNAVNTNITGIIVENTYEHWLQALESMLNSAEMRGNIRRNAYLDIKKNHNLDSPIEIFQTILEG